MAQQHVSGHEDMAGHSGLGNLLKRRAVSDAYDEYLQQFSTGPNGEYHERKMDSASVSLVRLQTILADVQPVASMDAGQTITMTFDPTAMGYGHVLKLCFKVTGGANQAVIPYFWDMVKSMRFESNNGNTEVQEFKCAFDMQHAPFFYEPSLDALTDELNNCGMVVSKGDVRTTRFFTTTSVSGYLTHLRILGTNSQYEYRVSLYDLLLGQRIVGGALAKNEKVKLIIEFLPNLSATSTFNAPAPVWANPFTYVPGSLKLEYDYKASGINSLTQLRDFYAANELRFTYRYPQEFLFENKSLTAGVPETFKLNPFSGLATAIVVTLRPHNVLVVPVTESSGSPIQSETAGLNRRRYTSWGNQDAVKVRLLDKNNNSMLGQTALTARQLDERFTEWLDGDETWRESAAARGGELWLLFGGTKREWVRGSLHENGTIPFTGDESIEITPDVSVVGYTISVIVYTLKSNMVKNGLIEKAQYF